MTGKYVIRLLRMLIAVIIMGICTGLLMMTSFGPDPCSAMNYGMARITGLSFGTYQVVFNSILFLFIFVCDKSLLGPGSFANMILIGYMADLTSGLLERQFGMIRFEGLEMRLMVMIPTLIIFVAAASIYMNSGLGTAPYDALPYLIHKRLCKRTEKEIKFRFVRMGYDALVTLIAVLIHGEAGIITVAMVFSLGPMVDMIGRWMNKK